MAYAICYKNHNGIEMYATDPTAGVPFSSTGGYQWRSYEKAANARESFKNSSSILKYTDNVYVKKVADDCLFPNQTPDEKQPVKAQKKKSAPGRCCKPDDPFIGEVTAAVNILKNIDQAISESSQALKYEEQCLGDLVHYLEFYTFSASEGYKLAKAIADHRKRRRVAKDRLHVLTAFKSECELGGAFSATQIELNRLKNRQYAPRQLDDLFERHEI